MVRGLDPRSADRRENHFLPERNKKRGGQKQKKIEQRLSGDPPLFMSDSKRSASPSLRATDPTSTSPILNPSKKYKRDEKEVANFSKGHFSNGPTLGVMALG